MSSVDPPASLDASALIDLIRRHGRFKPIRMVGSGGMAEVMKVRDEHLGVDRALKIMKPSLMQLKFVVDRFFIEAQAMSAIQHFNIVQVYDISEIKEGDTILFYYIVLEWCGGGSLNDHLERNGPMPPRQAVETMLSACNGLAVAHARGILHRDIKPDNIMLTAQGVPKLADFGIARSGFEPGSVRVTKMGTGMGTHGYMPLEQITHAAGVNAAYDIHALGMTLWHMISNKAPRVDPNHLLKWYQDFQSDDSLMERVPSVLVPLLRHATRIENKERFQTLSEFVCALELVLEQLPADPDDTIRLGLSIHENEIAQTEPQESSLPEGHPAPEQRPTHAYSSSLAATPIAPPPMQPVQPDAPVHIGTFHESNGQVTGIGLERSQEITKPRSGSRMMIVAASLLATVLAIVLVVFFYDRKETVTPEPLMAVAQPAAANLIAEALAKEMVVVGEPAVAKIAVASVPVLPASVSQGVSVASEPSKPSVVVVKDKPVARKPQAPVSAIATPASAPPHQEINSSAPTTVRVNMTLPSGDKAKVWLVGSAGRITLPANVPPGTYKVMGTFDDHDQPMTVISTLVVAPQSAITLTCSSIMASCKR